MVYAPIDFARESLGEVLRRAGFEAGRKTYYICEGVSTGESISARSEAALKAMDDAGREQAAQAAVTSGYWLAELAVPQRPSEGQPSICAN